MPNGNGQGKAPTSPTGLPALPKSGDFVPPEPSTAQRIIRALTLLSASQTGQPNLALSMFNQFRQQDALNQRAAQQKFDNAFERARLLRQNALTQEQIRQQRESLGLRKEAGDRAEEELQLSREAGVRAKKGLELTERQQKRTADARDRSQFLSVLNATQQDIGGVKKGTGVPISLMREALNPIAILQANQLPPGEREAALAGEFQKAKVVLQSVFGTEQDPETAIDPGKAIDELERIVKLHLPAVPPQFQKAFLEGMIPAIDPHEEIAREAEAGGLISKERMGEFVTAIVPSLANAMEDADLTAREFKMLGVVMQQAGPDIPPEEQAGALDTIFDRTVAMLATNQGLAPEAFAPVAQEIKAGLARVIENGDTNSLRDVLISVSPDPNVIEVSKEIEQLHREKQATEQMTGITAFEKVKRISDIEKRMKLLEGAFSTRVKQRKAGQVGEAGKRQVGEAISKLPKIPFGGL